MILSACQVVPPTYISSDCMFLHHIRIEHLCSKKNFLATNIENASQTLLRETEHEEWRANIFLSLSYKLKLNHRHLLICLYIFTDHSTTCNFQKSVWFNYAYINHKRKSKNILHHITAAPTPRKVLSGTWGKKLLITSSFSSSCI